MAKEKYYYVGVIGSGNDLTLVTDIKNKSAEWSRNKMPMDFPKARASDISEGLCANMIAAVVIESRFKLLKQFGTPDQGEGQGESEEADDEPILTPTEGRGR